MVLGECCPKHLNILIYFDVQIHFNIQILIWFWGNAVPNILIFTSVKMLRCKFYVLDIQLILEECRPKHFIFQCFSICCIDCTLKAFEFLYACTSQTFGEYFLSCFSKNYSYFFAKLSIVWASRCLPICLARREVGSSRRSQQILVVWPMNAIGQTLRIPMVPSSMGQRWIRLPWGELNACGPSWS